MAHRIDIVNMALSKIGQAPIASLEEDSFAATAANLVYGTCRRDVIQAYPWSFAQKTALLARRNTVPVGYAYAFALPADCLQPISLQGRQREGAGVDGEGHSYVVRGKSLLTNYPEAILNYVADIEDEDLFEAKFTEAFVVRLAAELAVPVGSKVDLYNVYRNEYEGLVRQAAAKSEQQNYEELSENPYLDSRL